MSDITDWRPSATLETLAIRAAMLAEARKFFAARNVLEIETPVLCSPGITDPHIESIGVVMHEGMQWLRTSPEYHMKRLLAAGCGDIYQIGKVFRGGESGRLHQPEFTMIEWYRHEFDLAEMAQETCELIVTLSNQAGHPVSGTERISYQDAFLRASGVDPFTASMQELREATLDLMPAFEQAGEQKTGSIEDRQIWIDLLAGATVYPSLTGNKLWVIDRFPADQAMLARLDPDDSRVAERFEVILDGVELANGFRELRDPAEQAARFALDCKRRAREGAPAMRPDSRLLAALEAGLPDCAGVAVGLDRIMLATNRLPELAATMSFVPGR